MLPYLFVIREIPQFSVGFLSFALLYRRQLWAILALLHELWQEQGTIILSIVQYVFKSRKHLDLLDLKTP